MKCDIIIMNWDIFINWDTFAPILCKKDSDFPNFFLQNQNFF